MVCKMCRDEKSQGDRLPLCSSSQTRERGERNRGHHPEASGETDGGRKHPADSGQDQDHPGARPVHQGQLSVPGPGQVHEHAQELPQHAPAGGLHLDQVSEQGASEEWINIQFGL